MTDSTAQAEPITRNSSATPTASAIDRWIFVFMAVWFIAITLTGFIPDSLMKIAAVEAGQRPPFPMVLHAHAVLMGAFLLLLLAQTLLVATGRQAMHEKVGPIGAVLAAALVVVGIVLVPTTYQSIWGALQAAPQEAQAAIRQGLREFDNIMLLQIRIGVLFPVFIAIALLARRRDSALHKRMIFLAVAMALPAAFDRITWLPTSLPDGPLTTDLYPLVALAPMFIWDLVRTRTVHKAYLIWLAIVVPASLVVHGLWGTDWWHAMAPRLVGLAP